MPKTRLYETSRKTGKAQEFKTYYTVGPSQPAPWGLCPLPPPSYDTAGIGSNSMCIHFCWHIPRQGS